MSRPHVRPAPRVYVLPVLFVLVVLSGCTFLENISPQTRLTDIVYHANDELRWGRVDLALMRVDAAWRARFLAQHRRWGRDVAVADVDVTNLHMGIGDDRSASIVTFHWIDQRSMELHETTLRQFWEPNGESFKLVGEEVVGGSVRLLEDPEIAVGLMVDEHGDLVPDLEGAGGEDALAAAGAMAAATTPTQTAGDGADLDGATSTTPVGSSAPRARDSQGVPID